MRGLVGFTPWALGVPKKVNSVSDTTVSPDSGQLVTVNMLSRRVRTWVLGF
jgi:hypothetical protein